MYPQIVHFLVKYFFCLIFFFSFLPLLNHSLSSAQLSYVTNIWPSQKDAFRGRQCQSGWGEMASWSFTESKLMPQAQAGNLFQTGNTILKMLYDQYLECLISAQSLLSSLAYPKPCRSHIWASADECFLSNSEGGRPLIFPQYCLRDSDPVLQVSLAPHPPASSLFLKLIKWTIWFWDQTRYNGATEANFF